jgi:EAL domain-containing protein (putative c-di-GMP-specific phosphodiesterase class I)
MTSTSARLETASDDVADLETVLDTVLSTGGVRTVFQPIVHLATGAVVAHEALSRGPAGPLERPDRSSGRP